MTRMNLPAALLAQIIINRVLPALKIQAPPKVPQEKLMTEQPRLPAAPAQQTPDQWIIMVALQALQKVVVLPVHRKAVVLQALLKVVIQLPAQVITTQQLLEPIITTVAALPALIIMTVALPVLITMPAQVALTITREVLLAPIIIVPPVHVTQDLLAAQWAQVQPEAPWELDRQEVQWEPDQQEVQWEPDLPAAQWAPAAPWAQAVQ